MNFKFIYKICTESELIDAKDKQKFEGTKKDLEDGFIHFSSEEQVEATLKKYYINQNNLVLLKVKTLNLDHLIWEQASDGNMFPHLYSHLDLTGIVEVKKISYKSDISYFLSKN